MTSMTFSESQMCEAIAEYLNCRVLRPRAAVQVEKVELVWNAAVTANNWRITCRPVEREVEAQEVVELRPTRLLDTGLESQDVPF